MKKTNVKSIARLVMGLACVLAFTTTNLGCACKISRCSSKPCCKKTAGCKEGCKKPCCQKAEAGCKKGCTKPCCKKT